MKPQLSTSSIWLPTPMTAPALRLEARQQQAMTLGGVQGCWTLRGSAEAVAQVWPWLWLGQWLHVGKETMMGMGGYTVESAIK